MLKPQYIPLNFITIPLASVLLLLATRVFNSQTVRDGIVGTGGVSPLNIMALFISLAYISISLDATGLLRFLAFWVANKGGSSGHRLFAYLYVFFLLCGVIVGNDPVILSGTAFLAYFTRAAGITPPTAWIFSQFAAANMASVVLVSSNPTNLVLSGAFSLSFLSYAAHVALPFLAAAACVFPLLLVLFRAPALIPPRIDVPLSPAEVRAALVDPAGAVFGAVLLGVTLAVLVGVSTVGVPVYMVTVPPAVIMLLRDVRHDWSRRNLQAPLSPAQDDGSGEDTEVEVQSTAHELHELASRTPSTTAPSSASTTSTSTHTRPYALLPRLQRAHARLTRAFPTVAHIAARLPLALLPFAFLMFVLVQGLAAQGWVALFARWWAAWLRATGVLGAVGGMGFLACVMCNFCGTNIGATILLARVIQLWLSTTSPAPGPRERDGAVYALALGSNFGACTLTFSASLAGLLWRGILREKGVRVRGAQFLALNLPVSALAMLVACAVLVGQVYVEHR
ncbi:hypothetical protein TRAPUB_1224 [Trametes pubescens]|uniref:Citrate transporter-like domain-containing protein n=1 Tax=Trametes pubescens TaxID=154538 RepID=A0A1M2VJU3_TRAPU|nr:hypothetical protein TRAPUB_1224 [Trametes pubescens]